MPFYVQRRVDPRSVETIGKFIDPKEAHRVAREYNLSDPTALHYVSRVPCKAWREQINPQDCVPSDTDYPSDCLANHHSYDTQHA